MTDKQLNTSNDAMRAALLEAVKQEQARQTAEAGNTIMKRIQKREAELMQNPQPSVMDRIRNREAELFEQNANTALEHMTPEQKRRALILMQQQGVWEQRMNELGPMTEKTRTQLLRERQLQARQAQAKASKSLGTRIWENVVGDDDPTTQNFGEKVGTALNMAGEAMTFGLIGDEASGAVAEVIPGGMTGKERTEYERQQQRLLEESNPGVALGAQIGGALVGPGKGAGAFINAGKGAAARVGRAALTSGAAGATYGAMEGEDATGRLAGAAVGLGAGMAGGAALTGIGQGFLRAAQAVNRHPALKEAIPTLEGLKESSRALFQAVEQSGAKLPRGRVVGLSRTLSKTLAKEGYHPRLHPKVNVIVEELSEMSESPQSMQRIMQLRRIAGGAAKSVEPDERRLAGIALDAIDKAVESLPKASKTMKSARELWGRMRRLELIENMIDDAARAKNFEQALQTAARGLLRHGGKKLRGFSGAERQAIARLAKGGSLQRSLEFLGRRLTPTSITGMAAAGGSAAYGSPTLGAISAGVGIASKAASNAMIRGNARAARDIVAMSPARQEAMNALLNSPNALAHYTPAPGISSVYLGKGD